MTELVSVIMPCYNASRWLFQAIKSILRQTYSNFELVAINDGSTDATARILEQAAKIDRRVHVLQLSRRVGIVGALNRGLEYAHGTVVARMDSDDVAQPRRFESQINELSTGVHLCGTWFREFGLGIPRITKLPHSPSAVRAALLFQNVLCHPTVMAKREVFENLQYREEYRLAEDYDLFARASLDYQISNVPEALLNYRRHPNQATIARRAEMETVTCRIRHNVLQQQGFTPTLEELRLHNMIRAPSSIRRIEDLRSIEAWLLKLYAAHTALDARRVIASQWVRACIRAAPLGTLMWKAYRSSELRRFCGVGAPHDIDVFLLSIARLEYYSPRFTLLRRFGFSA